MQQTTHYNLNKFQTTDKMNPTTMNGLNSNADTIDTQLYNLNSLLAGKESLTNKATSIGSSSTNTQYPSALAVKNYVDESMFQELTSPVRTWELNDGAYKIPADCVIYYKGTTDTTNFTIKTTGFLFVTHYSTSYKHWYLLCGNDGTIRYLYNGNSTATSGQVQPLRLDLNYLTSIWI